MDGHRSAFYPELIYVDVRWQFTEAGQLSKWLCQTHPFVRDLKLFKLAGLLKKIQRLYMRYFLNY